MPIWCPHAGAQVALGPLCGPPPPGPGPAPRPGPRVRGPAPRPAPCVGAAPRGRSEPALLLQTASGNVEAKVVCFYRRRDISSSLIALADKHASESPCLRRPGPRRARAPVPWGLQPGARWGLSVSSMGPSLAQCRGPGLG